MKEYIFIAKQLLKGRSVLRSYLNLSVAKHTINGRTIDVGGGGGVECLDTFQVSPDAVIEHFDKKTGQNINFEIDALPAQSDSYDTVIFLNVMEHIFNYKHIANEVVRITKPGGQLIGYVPFLMWYHPDHSDFFRYTDEALQKIFTTAGAASIEIEKNVKGPFTICAHMTMSLVPRILRPLYFLPLYLLDELFLKFQNNPDERHVLGYLFVIKK